MIASCMNDRARRVSGEHALSARLASEWAHNQADIYTLDEQDLTALWIDAQRARGKSDEQIIASYETLTEDLSLSLGEQTFDVINLYAATAINAGRDGRTLAALGRDMQRSGNVLGRFEVRPHNGRQYIIFKGNHRLREAIRGTRYGLSNPTMIRMGIGTDGLKGAAKAGILVTMVVSVSVNAYGWIFGDSIGWQEFLSNVSADLVKAAIAAALGIVLAKSVAATTGMIMLANTAGLVFTMVFGFTTARITWSDVSTLAQKTARLYAQSFEALSNPSTFLIAQKRTIRNFAYCTAEAAASTVLSAVQREVEARITRFLRQLSPLNLR